MEKGRFEVTPAALDDLEQLWLYIVIDASSDVANRLLDKVYDHFELLLIC